MLLNTLHNENYICAAVTQSKLMEPVRWGTQLEGEIIFMFYVAEVMRA